MASRLKRVFSDEVSQTEQIMGFLCMFVVFGLIVIGIWFIIDLIRYGTA